MFSVQVMGLGRTIRDLRLAKGWTLDDLEERSGVARGTISAIENRDSSRSEFFPALAKAFGLTVERLGDPRSFSRDAQGNLAVLSTEGEPLHAASEPEPGYGWPFPLVDQRRWDALDEQQKGFVQARLQQAIADAEAGGAVRARRNRVLREARGVLNSTPTPKAKRKT